MKKNLMEGIKTFAALLFVMACGVITLFIAFQEKECFKMVIELLIGAITIMVPMAAIAAAAHDAFIASKEEE